MISGLTVLRSSNGEPPEFEVGYFEYGKKGGRAYRRMTNHGDETQMRALLKSFGVSDDEIDALFANAKA